MLLYKIKNFYLDVYKVTPSEDFKNNLKSYTLSPTTEGLFVVVHQNKSVGDSHKVGINSGLKILYYYILTHKQMLNRKNLIKCCAQNCKFHFFNAAGLKDNEVHANKT